MDSKKDVRDFLVTRRAQVTPEQVGLPQFDRDRRVPGLRREEVAMLAGVSVDYYTKLERGNIAGASESVLDAIAKALLLNDVERAHLFDLAKAASATGARRRSAGPPERVRPSVQRVLDAMAVPAVVNNARQDIVAANALGRALYAPLFDTDQRPNIARFIYLDPRARDYYVDWPLARRTNAAILRMEAGRNPLDERLTALIGELSARSTMFAKDWARHNVHVHRTGVKSFRHPGVGVVEVSFDVFALPGETGLSIVTYSAEPGTPSADALALLPAWANAQEPATAVDPAQEWAE